MIPETWRTVKGWEDYEVSTHGRVRSHYKKTTPQLINVCPDKAGYGVVGLSCSRGRKSFKIHYLVAVTHIGPRPEGLVIRHLDGNKLNNYVTNLAYGTHKENTADKRKHGTFPGGEKWHASKLTDDQVIELRNLYNSTSITQHELAKLFGCSQAQVSRIVNKLLRC